MNSEFGEEFKEKIKSKETLITKRFSTGIQETINYRRLKALLRSYHDESLLNQDFVISIKPDQLEVIDISIDQVKATIDQSIKKHHNFIEVNKNFSIINSIFKELPDTNTVIETFKELSNEYCIFVINADGVFPFVGGTNLAEDVFLIASDRAGYKKLFHIQDLELVFNKYRIFITERDIYRQFFVSKVNLALWASQNKGLTGEQLNDFKGKNAHYLQNKPEDIFRENLRKYLKENLKDTNFLSKEYITATFNRVDIFINDEYGDLHTIEVKWIGTSIREKGLTEYCEDDINPDAVLQSLKYIKELDDSEEKIKLGYLVVFDARKEDLPDSVGENFDESLIVGKEKYYSRFIKPNDFRVVNKHPY